MRVITVKYINPGEELMNAWGLVSDIDGLGNVFRLCDVKDNPEKRGRAWKVMDALKFEGEPWGNHGESMYLLRNIYTGKYIIAHISDMTNLY